ncbi:MAG: M3 family oligoendopeptidase [Desulfopila sp.]|jgi:oligoendopeptidase F|nr:M3 family oligoendopeptidase [Desulfopila sp.]
MSTEKPLNEILGTTQILWNLTDLYSSTEDPAVKSDIEWCKDEGATLARDHQGKLAQLQAEEMYALVARLESLQTRLGKLATFAFLNFTTQVDNSAAGAFYQEIREIISQVEKNTVFFELEWNMLPDDHASTLLQEDKLLGYRHYLQSMRRYRPHQLTEAEEKLLIERKIVGRSSWTTLFEKVFGHLRFGPNKRTEEEVLTDLYSSDREVRSRAAAEMTEGLKSQSHILTHIFNTLAAEKMITDRLRSHRGWVSAMNLDNQVEDATVDALIGAVTGRYDIVQRYYRVKKELLSLDELRDYDRYAPLPALPTKQIDWQGSRAIVLDAFASFSPRMAETAERFFEKNYIHAPLLPGKRGGAFAHPCIPEVHPYVMVNYSGTLRDISTVAHELGHGIHQVLAAEKGYFSSDTPLVLAETASVFAELLVFKAQLALLENPAEKKAYICQKLESIFATVFRQTAMNRFEEAMHQGRRQKGELSCEQLSAFWLETQREMFGDAVNLSEDYGIWWSYIPHFLATPGYVYSYAFGELLVLALYNLYENEGQPFIEKYFNLLAAGGSDTPYALLQPFGIDLNDQNFWNQGLDLIDSMLREVENSHN